MDDCNDGDDDNDESDVNIGDGTISIGKITSSSLLHVISFVGRNILDRLRLTETLFRRHLHQLESRYICIYQLSAPVRVEINQT